MAKKPLAHNPETIAQFVELHLFPPTQAAEIPAALDQLHGRLVFYQKKSADELSLRRQQKQLCQQQNIDDKEEDIEGCRTVPPDDAVPAPVQIVVDTVGDSSTGSADDSVATTNTTEVELKEDNDKVNEDVVVGDSINEGVKEVILTADVDNVPSILQDNIEVVNEVTKTSENDDAKVEGTVPQKDAENTDGGAKSDVSKPDQDNAHTDSNPQSNTLKLSLNGVGHHSNTVQQENLQESDAENKEIFSNDRKLEENGSDTIEINKPFHETDHDETNQNTSSVTDESSVSRPISSMSKEEGCPSPTRNGGGGKLERKLLSDSFDSSGVSCDQETTGKDIHPSIV